MPRRPSIRSGAAMVRSARQVLLLFAWFAIVLTQLNLTITALYTVAVHINVMSRQENSVSVRRASPLCYRAGFAALAALTLVGCAAPRSYSVGAPRASIPPAPTEIAVYPANGQSARRLDRDRYECHLWAVRESRYDPSGHARYYDPPPRVEPDPPSGYSTTTGAVAGAVIGAAVANPRRTAEGAAIGAVVGAVAGSAEDRAREARAQAIEDSYAGRREYRQDRRADGYRRAISACLEGRGYSVR